MKPNYLYRPTDISFLLMNDVVAVEGKTSLDSGWKDMEGENRVW